jgi:hypothetical protein
VALNPKQAIPLARTLRDLPEAIWPDLELTLAQLTEALRGERLGGANHEGRR